MIRGSEAVPSVPDLPPGYELRQVNLEDKHSYSQTFLTAFDDASPFGDLMKHALPEGFFVVEHLPTGTVVAASTAAVYQKSQYPDGHSLQWVVAHSDHRGTGYGSCGDPGSCRSSTNLLVSIDRRFQDPGDQHLPETRVEAASLPGRADHPMGDGLRSPWKRV